jgi:exodeoxyribonuclease VII large subunit
LARQQLADKGRGLAQAAQRLARRHPRRRLADWLQRLDEAQGRLRRCGGQGVRRQRVAWQHLAERLGRVRPAWLLRERGEALRQAGQRLREQARHRLDQARQRAEAAAGRLRLLGPEQVLARGYSITMDAASGAVLRKAKAVRAGQRLKTRLQVGEVRSVAEPSSDQ